MLRLVALLLPLCCTASPHDISRKLLARDFPAGSCDNTRQGRWFITDDRGVLCSRDTVDVQSGCCTRGQKHSCDTCSLEDQCCESFEHCVSCCLAPAHGADGAAKEVFRGTHRSETGLWETTFDYCRGKCRTSSNSTVNENSYLARNKYCFSALGKPIIPEPPLPVLGEGVDAVMGQLGESCTAACAAVDKTCSAPALAALNSCNVLRTQVPCEAGCAVHVGFDAAPAYVSSQAEKGEQPTFCWVRGALPAESEQAVCDAAASMLQRLCACALRPAQDLLPATESESRPQTTSEQ